MHRYHITLIIGYEQDVQILEVHVKAESDKQAWDKIRAMQDFFIKNGATACNTAEYRQLLDRDGYRY